MPFYASYMHNVYDVAAMARDEQFAWQLILQIEEAKPQLQWLLIALHPNERIRRERFKIQDFLISDGNSARAVGDDKVLIMSQRVLLIRHVKTKSNIVIAKRLA